MTGVSDVPVGILGVGHFGAALARGLIRSGIGGGHIVLSPRGSATRALVAEFGLAVAADNAELVSRSEIVILAVRPPEALDAIRTLPWREHQLLISVCAGVPLRDLESEVRMRPEIVRAMPMTAAAIGASPTVLFPDHPRARTLLERLGSVTALSEESQFDAATALAVAYTFCHDLVARTAAWAAAAGFDRDTARILSAAHFEAAARVAASSPLSSLDVLATRGGVAEAAYGPLHAARYDDAWAAAFDAALARVQALGAKS